MDASRGGIFHVSPTQLNRLDIYAHSFRRLRQPSRGAFSFLIVFCFSIISNMDWKIKITPPSPQSPRKKKTFWEGRLAWSCCTPLLIFFFTFGKGVMERGGIKKTKSDPHSSLPLRYSSYPLSYNSLCLIVLSGPRAAYTGVQAGYTF